MPRFFIETNIADETDRIEIKGADARHIRDVLRMQPGERLTVCDGARADLLCSIEGFSGDRVSLNILSRCRNRTEPSFEATLYQGLPKGEKFDLIIQKCVELGISRIVPVACERSIVKIPATDAPRKVQRWMRIAQEAAKQCGRGHIPEVTQPIRFADAIAQVKVNFPTRSAEDPSSEGLEKPAGLAAFIPFEGERILSLRDFLESEDPCPSDERPSYAFFIGPEGGFSPDEVAAATAAGIRSVSLGRRILRTETASLAVLAMIGYHCNDF